MRTKLVILFLGWACTLPLSAAVVTLKSGQTMQGEILIHNEEVLIIRNSSGARFQYPIAEVVSINEEEQPVETTETVQEETKLTGKKTTFLVELAGGASFLPNSATGGHAGGELMLGSRYIGNRHIFIGGGLGVHGFILNQQSYIFLPLEVAIKVPIIEGKHAPYVGARFGYGFAVSKNCDGGIIAGFEVGYRNQLNSATTLFVGLNTQFQQTTMDVTETITNDGVTSSYINHSGRNLVLFGARIGFTF